MITLKQITPALISLGVDVQNIDDAIRLLTETLLRLDEVEVRGRQKVDTLLGCMMAIEAIIGEKENG